MPFLTKKSAQVIGETGPKPLENCNTGPIHRRHSCRPQLLEDAATLLYLIYFYTIPNLQLTRGSRIYRRTPMPALVIGETKVKRGRQSVAHWRKEGWGHASPGGGSPSRYPDTDMPWIYMLGGPRRYMR